MWGAHPRSRGWWSLRNVGRWPTRGSGPGPLARLQVPQVYRDDLPVDAAPLVVSTIVLYRYFVSVMLAPFSHDATTSEAKELYTLIGLVALLFAGATAMPSGIARFDGDLHASHRGLLVALAVVYGALALHVYPTIARDILVGFVMYGLYAASPAATGLLTKHVTEQSGIVQHASGKCRPPREIDREIAPRVVRLELSLAAACHIRKLVRGRGSESGGLPSDGLLVVEYANVVVDDWDSRRYPLCRPFFGQPGGRWLRRRRPGCSLALLDFGPKCSFG